MNGLDRRLERELEAVLIIMEAFDGFESIVRYDIVGHSGEDKNIPFVDAMHPPVNAERRLKILQVRIECSNFTSSTYLLFSTYIILNYS